MKIIQFPYTILNGELLHCQQTIAVEIDEVDVIGTRTADVLDGIGFINKTAFYIQYMGASYGSEVITQADFANLINDCCGLQAVINSPFNGNTIANKPSSVIVPLTIGADVIPAACKNAGTTREIRMSYDRADGVSVPEFSLITESYPFVTSQTFSNYTDFLIGKSNGLGGVWVQSLPTGANTSILDLAGATITIKNILTGVCGSDEKTISFVAPLMRRTLHIVGMPARNGSMPELMPPFGSGQFPQNFSEFKNDRDVYGHNYSKCGRNISFTVSRMDVNGAMLFNKGQAQQDMLWDMQSNYEYIKPFILSSLSQRTPEFLINDVILSGGNFCGGATNTQAYTSFVLKWDYKKGDDIQIEWYLGATYNDGINNIWDNATENNNGSFSISYSGLYSPIANGYDADPALGYYLGWQPSLIASQLINPVTALGWA